MKIAYLILNTFDNDSRARLEVETLKKAGHEIDIIVTRNGKLTEFMGCRIHRIEQNTWPSRKIRFIQYNIRGAAIASKLNPDIFHAVDLDTLQAAFWANIITKGKIVYESRELYTELEALNGRKIVKAFWRNIEKRLIRRADMIITINDSIAHCLIERYGIKSPVIIRNVAKVADQIQAVDLRIKFNIPDDHKIILYQGVLREGQGLKRLIEMLPYLPEITLILIGDGPLMDTLKSAVQASAISERVKFIGQLPTEELQNYTSGADAGMLLMEDIALNNRLALPQKIFQYLAAGLPQIVSPLPEIKRLVKSESTGFILPFGSARETAPILQKYLNDPEGLKNARINCQRALEKYNWQKESQKLIEVYEGLGS